MSWKEIPVGKAYILGAHGLRVSSYPTVADASAVLEFVYGLERRSPWWAGDVFNDIRERYPETYLDMLGDVGYKLDTLERYGRVCRSIPPGPDRDEVESVPFAVYQSAQSLTPAVRAEVLQQVKDEGLTLSEARQVIRRKARKVLRRDDAEISGFYRVVYIDRPSGVELSELEALDVGGHTQENAAVFVWLSDRLRGASNALLEGWGFRHGASFIWDAVVHDRPSHYNSERHEHLVWGVKGECSPDERSPLRDSVCQIRGAHGQHPDEFLEMVEALYTTGPYLGLYSEAGFERDGWTFYGRKIGEAA